MSNTAPFGLGKTWYGDSETIDVSSSYANAPAIHLEGRECFHGDVTDPLTRPNTTRSADIRKTIIVRNASGVTLQGGYPVTWGTPGKRVNGYSRVYATKVAGVVDPSLGTTGVRDGDLFHLVVDGAVSIKSAYSGAAAQNNIAVGDPIYAMTAAAACATTTTVASIPRFSSVAISNNLTADVTDTSLNTYIGNVAKNHFGYALSANGTTVTDTAVLVQVRCER